MNIEDGVDDMDVTEDRVDTTSQRRVVLNSRSDCLDQCRRQLEDTSSNSESDPDLNWEKYDRDIVIKSTLFLPGSCFLRKKFPNMEKRIS